MLATPLASAVLALSPLAPQKLDAATGGFDCLVPPSPRPFEVQHGDGRTSELYLRGTGLHSWLETGDGYPVVRDGGAWVYARLAGGRLVGTPAVVGLDEPRPFGVVPDVRPEAPPLSAAAALPREALLRASAAPLPEGTRPAGPAPQKTAGQVDNLVILVRFADHGTDGQDRNLPRLDEVGVVLNEPGGDPFLAPTGSVRDHYLENSYGQLAIDSTVVGWIDVPETETYYANGNSGLTSLTWDLITAALEGADPTVDFGEFDADGDGWIDAITFLHSGYGAEWGGEDVYGTWYADRMWSHKWTIPTWTSEEGVSVADYNISPGLWGLSGDAPGRIGVVAHELGHFFGLPDLYDTDGSSQGLGNWDLMAAGSWGFDGTQLHPSHMSAWSKAFLGWLQPRLVGPGTYRVDRIEGLPAAYRIDSGYPPGEYLLLENRQNEGFDLVLPQAGLAVYHVDEARGSLVFNDVNSGEGHPGQGDWPENGEHYRIALLQADGYFDLESNVNRGDEGDLFRAPFATALDGATVPSLDAYQQGMVVANGNGLLGIGKPARGIRFTYANPGAPGVATRSLPEARVGEPYAVRLSATGGNGALTWSEFRPASEYDTTVLADSGFEEVGEPQGWHADDEVWPLDLPFRFPFGETAYERVWVSSNGFLDFRVTQPDPFNDSVLLRGATRIAPLWDDLVTAPGEVYVDTSVPRRVTIRWEAVTYFALDPVAFSVVLLHDGTIEFHYGPGNIGVSPTVGIGHTLGVNVDLVPGYDGEDDLESAPSVRFDLEGSQLPPGLFLAPDGLLYGTPTQAGDYAPILRATDVDRVYGQAELPLVVAPE